MENYGHYLVDDALFNNALDSKLECKDLQFSSQSDVAGIAYDAQTGKYIAYLTDERGYVQLRFPFDTFDKAVKKARQLYIGIVGYYGIPSEHSHKPDKQIALVTTQTACIESVQQQINTAVDLGSIKVHSKIKPSSVHAQKSKWKTRKLSKGSGDKTVIAVRTIPATTETTE